MMYTHDWLVFHGFPIDRLRINSSSRSNPAYYILLLSEVLTAYYFFLSELTDAFEQGEPTKPWGEAHCTAGPS